MKTLRKRTHNVFFDYSNQELNWELKSPANLKLKGEESNVSIAYGYNYGYFEIWGQIAAAKINNSDLKGTTSGVGITINAIENVPGNNVIPYATIGIGYHNEDREINGQDYNAQGNISFFGVGIKWYPLGEIFAIKLSLEKVLADLSISSTILSDDVNSNYELEGLHVGYIFSF